MGHDYNPFIIRAIYIFINLINIFVMYHYGTKIARSSNKKNIFHYALIIVAVYSVCMGLRFGREIDYNHLFEHYNDIGKDFSSNNNEWFFKSICWLLYHIGVPFSGFVWLCSIMMISSFLHLCINHYKEYAPLAFLIFLWEAHDVELLIRYYLAFSILLFALSYYKSHKYKKAAILAFLACSTHVGMIIPLSFIIGFSFIKKNFAPPIVILSLLVFSLFFAQTQIMEVFAPYINFLGFNEKTAAYVDSYTDIVEGNFSAAGSLAREFSWRYAIVILLKWGLPIFLIPRLIKEEKISALECNMFYVGIIVAPLFLQIQILNRIAEVFTFYSVFVSSAACYYVFRNPRKYNSLVIYYAYLVAFLTVWPAISQVITRENWWHMLFIWDAGDWDTIPINYFLNE